MERIRGVFKVDVGLVIRITRGFFGGLPLLERVVAITGVTHSFSLSLPPLPSILSLLYQNVGWCAGANKVKRATKDVIRALKNGCGWNVLF